MIAPGAQSQISKNCHCLAAFQTITWQLVHIDTHCHSVNQRVNQIAGRVCSHSEGSQADGLRCNCGVSQWFFKPAAHLAVVKHKGEQFRVLFWSDVSPVLHTVVHIQAQCRQDLWLAVVKTNALF